MAGYSPIHWPEETLLGAMYWFSKRIAASAQLSFQAAIGVDSPAAPCVSRFERFAGPERVAWRALRGHARLLLQTKVLAVRAARAALACRARCRTRRGAGSLDVACGGSDGCAAAVGEVFVRASDQVGRRVDGTTVVIEAEVEMGIRAVPRFAQSADAVSSFEAASDLEARLEAIHVSIVRFEATTVIDEHVQPISRLWISPNWAAYAAVSRSDDWSSDPRRDVDAAVKAGGHSTIFRTDSTSRTKVARADARAIGTYALASGTREETHAGARRVARWFWSWDARLRNGARVDGRALPELIVRNGLVERASRTIRREWALAVRSGFESATRRLHDAESGVLTEIEKDRGSSSYGSTAQGANIVRKSDTCELFLASIDDTSFGGNRVDESRDVDAFGRECSIHHRAWNRQVEDRVGACLANPSTSFVVIRKRRSIHDRLEGHSVIALGLSRRRHFDGAGFRSLRLQLERPRDDADCRRNCSGCESQPESKTCLGACLVLIGEHDGLSVDKPKSFCLPLAVWTFGQAAMHSSDSIGNASKFENLKV